MSYTTQVAQRRYLDRIDHLNSMVKNDPDLRQYNMPGTPGYVPDLLVADLLQEENDIKLQMQVRSLTHKSSISTPEEMIQCSPTDVDIETLKMDASNNFYSYDAVKALGCAVGAVFYGISEDHGDIVHAANLKSEIRGSLKKVGGPSVSGHALSGGIGDANNLYIVKVPQQKGSEKDLTHELWAAINCINGMRKGRNGKPGIPNLAMVLAGPMCSPAVISEDKSATVCSGVGDKVQYTIYENIFPAVSLEKYVLSCSARDFLSVYSQELRTLRIASHYIGYTHYDAHTENKMMRTSNKHKKFSIPYEKPGTDIIEYVTATVVSTTIDYGMCSVRYEGVDYGANDTGLSAYGIVAGPNPLHDAYKTLMFVGQDLMIAGLQNGEVFREAAKIFRYFNKKESYSSCVISQRNLNDVKGLRDMYYSYIPDYEDTLSLEGLISHVSQVCDLRGIVTDTPEYPVLECGSGSTPEDRCFTFQGEIDKAAREKKLPDSILEFYDVLSRVTDESTQKHLVEKFNYADAKAHFIDLLTREIQLLDKSINNDVVMDIPVLKPGVGSTVLRSSDLVNALSSGFNLLLSAVASYENASIWLKIAERIAILYQDHDLVSKIEGMRMDIASHNAKINSAVQLYRNNYKNMSNTIESVEWIELLHNKYPWYRDSSSAIVGLVDRVARDERDLYKPLQLPAVMLPISRSTRQSRDSVLPETRRTKLVRDNEGLPLKVCTACST